MTATLLLLDTVEERQLHEAEYAPLVKEILATSSNRSYRFRAIDSLDAWRHDTAMLRRKNDPATADHTVITWADEPPF